jgi:DNA modification methylase
VKPQIVEMKLSELTPAPYNPRKISREALMGLSASIKRWGIVQPIVWNKRTSRIVGGHQRVRAMQSEGITEAPVVVVDLSDSDEKAMNVTLNNPAIEGEFTDDLQAILNALKDEMPETFGALNLTALLADIQPKEGKTDPDAVPEAPKKAVTKLGDLWLLGNHRLLCGDSTNEASVKKALDGKKAMMIFTDPPWNVAIGKDSNPRHRQREGLQNDDLGADFGKFLNGWAGACLPSLDGDIYCVMGCGEWPTIDASLRKAGMHWSSTIVWVKDAFVLGRSQYHRRFEPIWYGWSTKAKSTYTGGRAQDDVWEFPRPKASPEHPTMKPVALVEKAVANSSKVGGIVFDPFLGSGTSLLAAERLDRACVGLELEPRFCDVIVERWENFTGKKATRSK